jgi:hypothetical protein
MRHKSSKGQRYVEIPGAPVSLMAQDPPIFVVEQAEFDTLAAFVIAISTSPMLNQSNFSLFTSTIIPEYDDGVHVGRGWLVRRKPD